MSEKFKPSKCEHTKYEVGCRLCLEEALGEAEKYFYMLCARDHVIGELVEYASHQSRCIRTYREAGQPTIDGGYQVKFKGKWYQLRPIDETPKCDCGLKEALSSAERVMKEKK